VTAAPTGVECVDWRLIFFINVPVGILGAVAAILVLPQFPGRVGCRCGCRNSCSEARGSGRSTQLHTITLDTTREHIMALLMLQYTGVGLSMMPIFSVGLAVIPTAYTNVASAYNNVVQRKGADVGDDKRLHET
jgi:MFS family permease